MMPEYGAEELTMQESERLRERSEGLIADEREDSPERVIEEQEYEERELEHLNPEDN
jgi:hypothetical protein